MENAVSGHEGMVGGRDRTCITRSRGWLSFREELSLPLSNFMHGICGVSAGESRELPTRVVEKEIVEFDDSEF
jgi:hypothetical protein